ncbi:LysR family transcriptional regulator, partial [Pseudomonas aeruginosa]
PWAIRERSLLVRDLEALPSCLRALIDELQRVGDSL